MAEIRRVKRGLNAGMRRRFIGVWVPVETVTVIEQAVAVDDTDVSKWVRRALEEKAQREIRELQPA